MLETGVGDENATGAAHPPTARPQACPTVRVVGDHHPSRYLALVAALFRENPGFGDLPDIEAHLAAWAAGRPLQPLDRLMLSIEDPFQGSFFFAEEIGRLTGTSHDAAALARDWSAIPSEAGAWDPALAGDTVYLHFGAHAFPSPFPGLGVEGCYVEAYAVDGGLPDYVAFRFVLSPDLAPKGERRHADSPEVRLRDLARGMEVGFSPSAGQRAGAALGSNPARYPEAYRALWAPYLPPLLNAAWHGLAAVRRPAPHGTPDGLSHAYAEAGREDVRHAIAVEIADGEGKLVVRYLGRAPVAPGTATEWIAAPYPAAGTPDIAYEGAACDALLADAREAAAPGTALAHADRALALAILGVSAGATGATRHWTLAQSLRANALAALGEDAAAAAVASQLAGLLAADPDGLVPGIVGLLVASGDMATARALLERLGEPDEDPAHAWTLALVASLSGRPARRDFAIGCAMSLEPRVGAALLSGKPLPWLWHPGPGERTRDPVRIAAALEAGWRRVPEHRAILAAARLDLAATRH